MAGHAGTAPASASPTLTGPRPARRTSGHLVARKERVAARVAARTVDGYTLNGTSPGPDDRRAGRASSSRCTLRNESVPDGRHAALARRRRAQRRGRRRRRHAGRRAAGRLARLPVRRPTTPALLVPLPPGVPRAGRGGLFGALVVHPRDAGRRGRRRARGRTPYDGRRTVNGRTGDVARRRPRAGQRGAGARRQHRQRARCGSGSAAAPYRVVAVDGHDVNEPAGRRATRRVVVTGRRPGRPRGHRARTGRGRWTSAASSAGRRPGGGTAPRPSRSPRPRSTC